MSHVATPLAPPALLRRCRRPLMWLATGLCGLLLLGVGVVNLVAPKDSAFVYERCVGVLVIVATWCLCWRISRRLDHRFFIASRVHTYTALILAAVTAVIAYYSQYAYDWDPRAVRRAAFMVTHGQPLDGETLSYFARYPNNLSLGLLDTMLARIALTTHLSFATVTIMWNTALLLAAQLVLAACLRRHGRARLVLPMLVVTFMWVGTSSIMVVPYTDIPGFFIASVLVFLVLDVRRRRSLPWVAGQIAGICALVGLTFTLKPYVSIVVIAGALVYLFTTHFWRGCRRANPWVFVVVLAVASVSGLWVGKVVASEASRAVVGVSSEELRNHNSPFPLTHWIAMGIHDTHAASPARTYGSFNTPIMRRDVKIKDPQLREHVIMHGIKDDLKRQGVRGNASFFANKVAWILGDGNFYAQKDGSDFRKGPLRPSVIGDFTMLHGRHHQWKAGVVQGLWCSFILQLGGLLLTRKRTVVSSWLAVAILGFVMYEIPFEGRSRYVLAFLPVFLVAFASASKADKASGRLKPGT